MQKPLPGFWRNFVTYNLDLLTVIFLSSVKMNLGVFYIIKEGYNEVLYSNIAAVQAFFYFLFKKKKNGSKILCKCQKCNLKSGTNFS